MRHSSEPVIVVGAGFGGLAAAVDLALSGVPVHLVEREPRVGGKARTVTVDGAAIETGPTVLTMREVFDELLEPAGARLEHRLTLSRLPVLARHAWPDGSRLDLFDDPARSAAAIAALAGEREAGGYLAFLSYARRLFESAQGPFLSTADPGLGSAIRTLGAGALALPHRLDVGRTLWRAVSAHFRDPRLRQLFGRYATYCGGSPFETPATYNLVAHVEARGVWRVEGGLSRLARLLAEVAEGLGVRLTLGAGVESIEVEGGSARAVRLEGGERLPASAVVLNADPQALADGRFGPELKGAVRSTSRERRSLSAVTFALRARTAGMPLEHHNVFFGPDYRSEFDTLFRDRRMPEAPTVYACAFERPGPVDGPEPMLLVLNAPADGDLARPPTQEILRWQTEAFETLSRCGLSVEPASLAAGVPADHEALSPSTGGALYGPVPHGALSPLQRNRARTAVRGLYLAGGSVHPAPGVPLASWSGRLAARALRSDLGWISRPRRAATAGGTSTSSPTTGATASS